MSGEPPGEPEGGKEGGKKKRQSRSGSSGLRRFKSAFIFYSASRHNELRRELERHGINTKTTDVAKMLSTEWQNMTAGEKEPWLEKSRADKARYDAEKVTYMADKKSKGDRGYKSKRLLKDEGAPKRPTSAYLSYSNERRAEMKRKHPTATNGMLSRYLSESWKNASEEEKSSYLEVAARSQEQYKTELATWKKTKTAELKAKRRKEQADGVREVAAAAAAKQNDQISSGAAGAAVAPVAAAAAASTSAATAAAKRSPSLTVDDQRLHAASGGNYTAHAPAIPQATREASQSVPAPSRQGMDLASLSVAGPGAFGGIVEGSYDGTVAAAALGAGASPMSPTRRGSEVLGVATSRAGLLPPLVTGHELGNSSALLRPQQQRTTSPSLIRQAQQLQPLHHSTAGIPHQVGGGDSDEASRRLSQLRALLLGGQQQEQQLPAIYGALAESAATAALLQHAAAPPTASVEMANILAGLQHRRPSDLGVGDSSRLISTLTAQQRMLQRQILAHQLQQQMNQTNALPSSLLLQHQEQMLLGGSGSLGTSDHPLLTGRTAAGLGANVAATAAASGVLPNLSHHAPPALDSSALLAAAATRGDNSIQQQQPVYGSGLTGNLPVGRRPGVAASAVEAHQLQRASLMQQQQPEEEQNMHLVQRALAVQQQRQHRQHDDESSDSPHERSGGPN